MADQYLIQFLEDGTLIKQHEITEQCPFRENVPEGRTQIIIDDKETFEFLVEQYRLHKQKVKFNVDCTIKEIIE